MNAILALLALASVAYAAQDNCAIESGRLLRPFGMGGGQRAAKIDIPCKYVAVNQNCGAYKVKLVPGNTYVAPRFFVNTMWMEFKRLSDGKGVDGRVWTKSGAKYINYGTPEPFRKKRGDLEASDIFTWSTKTVKGKMVVEFMAKNGDFKIVIGPYDPVGEKQRNVYFKFECYRDDVPTAFPDALCGNQKGQGDVIELGKQLGWVANRTKAKMSKRARDKIYYYAILNAMDVDQTPNPSCYDASNALAACPSLEKKTEAIDRCYTILISKPHRKCISMFTCDIMKTFAACVNTVCSNFTRGDDCNEIGDAIDMCRTFPDLSDKLGETCYKGLFIDVEKPSSDAASDDGDDDAAMDSGDMSGDMGGDMS